MVFLGFAPRESPFKLLGLGAALAVLMDATVIRGVLVPAAMRLAGEASWWAPGWLRAVHDRLGLSETTTEALPVPARRPAADVAPGGGRPVRIRRRTPAHAVTREDAT